MPVKVESGDPLVTELAININSDLKKYNLFPKIK